MVLNGNDKEPATCRDHEIRLTRVEDAVSSLSTRTEKLETKVDRNSFNLVTLKSEANSISNDVKSIRSIAARVAWFLVTSLIVAVGTLVWSHVTNGKSP